MFAYVCCEWFSSKIATIFLRICDLWNVKFNEFFSSLTNPFLQVVLGFCSSLNNGCKTTGLLLHSCVCVCVWICEFKRSRAATSCVYLPSHLFCVSVICVHTCSQTNWLADWLVGGMASWACTHTRERALSGTLAAFLGIPGFCVPPWLPACLPLRTAARR